MTYASQRPHWERAASIRSRPRRILGELREGEHLYPISRQPLCVHPRVAALGPGAAQFILIQSLYKFLRDIAFIETEVVGRVALAIANDQLRLRYPEEARRDALLVLIDEAYHAHVAHDFLDQVRARTGVEPLAAPPEIELTRAVRAMKARLPERHHEELEVVAVCVAESSITTELIDVGRETGLERTYQQINADHMVDEARHSAIFRQVLAHLWAETDEPARASIGALLPDFLEAYLQTDLQRAHDAAILRALRLDEAELTQVIADTHLPRSLEDLQLVNPTVKNVMKLLASAVGA